MKWIPFVLLLASCSVMPQPTVLPESEREIQEFLATVRYVTDMEQFGRSYWQSPAELCTTMAGDCDDKAVFYQWAADRLGVRYNIAAVINGRGVGHAVIERDGKYYETNGKPAVVRRVIMIYTIEQARIKAGY